MKMIGEVAYICNITSSYVETKEGHQKL